MSGPRTPETRCSLYRLCRRPVQLPWTDPRQLCASMSLSASDLRPLPFQWNR